MRLGFLTVALGDLYEQFVAPWAAAALITFPESTAEVVVQTPSAWSRGARGRQLAALRAQFGDRLLLRAPSIPWRRLRMRAGTVRFCERPTLGDPLLLHIGDVDLLLSDPSLPGWHLDAMGRLGLPYSNRIRPGQRRLTGLHVVQTDRYYGGISPANMSRAIREWATIGDEAFLYKLCARHHGLPNLDVGRPDFGIHCSPNRPPTRERGCHWGIESYRETHARLIESPAWRSLVETFDPRFRHRLRQIRERMGT